MAMDIFQIQMYFLKYSSIYLWKIWCQLFYCVCFAHTLIRMKFSDEHWLTLKYSIQNAKLILVCAFGPNTVVDYIKMIFNGKTRTYSSKLSSQRHRCGNLPMEIATIEYIRCVFELNKDKPKSQYHLKLIRLRTRTQLLARFSH